MCYNFVTCIISGTADLDKTSVSSSFPPQIQVNEYIMFSVTVRDISCEVEHCLLVLFDFEVHRWSNLVPQTPATDGSTDLQLSMHWEFSQITSLQLGVVNFALTTQTAGVKTIACSVNGNAKFSTQVTFTPGTLENNNVTTNEKLTLK